MNYLALVNRTRLECGVSAQPLATFTSLGAADQRIVTWVAQAWEDLQMLYEDWNFTRSQFSFTTVAGQVLYLPPAILGVAGADARTWERDTLRNYATAVGFGDEMVLPFMDYPTFRSIYTFGAMRSTTGRPISFTIDPATHGFQIGPVPLAGYTIDGDYHLPITQLVGLTDDPGVLPVGLLPARFHMLLVWMAAQSYGFYEAAPEVKQRADKERARLQSRLEEVQLPGITYGAPLA